MAVSIKDIGRLAGVSHSTVSRALRNSPLISPKTARRIQKIARESGYSASEVARSLVTQKTHAIGVVVTSIADPFNGEVVAGIEETANRRGYSVILASSQTDPEREIAVVRSFRERRLDGILVASSRVGALYGPLLSELKIPVVLINNQHPGEFAHSVTIDNVHGAYLAVRHLIELGHRKIAYVGDRSGLHSDAERFAGYKKALAEAGIPVRRPLAVRGNGKPEGAARAAAPLLARRDRPSAVFCYNDMSALGVIQEASKNRLAVPADLSVAGFDDIFFAELLQPPLTTIRQPKREMGRQAMELLFAILNGERAERAIVIRGELVVRGSTAKSEAGLTSRG
ncbi:MAG: LacI family DNA-binding transcriptional regulator, partial [Bryobacteraceae bacterium]